MSQSTFLRVNRRTPCVICGATRWCGISDDGSAAICMHVAKGAIKETRNGGYLHILQDREFTPQQRVSFQDKPISSIAPIDRRNAIYQALLSLLPLSRSHANELERRGRSDEAIAHGMYATLPQTSSAIYKTCAALVEQFGPLSGIPGLYPDHEGQWRMPPCNPGFLIPARDARGRIQACQIRFDNVRSGARYIWFSSNPDKYKGGTSAPAAIHFARPWRITATCEAIITEGPLKADIISEIIDLGVIALPSVSSFQSDLGEHLKALFPTLRSVAIAFDSDWHTKAEVERAMLRLARIIQHASFDWDVWDWSGAKGLDDLLMMQGGIHAA